MQLRELRAMGMETTAKDRLMTTNIHATAEDRSKSLIMTEQLDLSPEVFGLIPNDTEIDPATTDGANHCMKASEELERKYKLQLLITNIMSAKNHFENFSSKHDWGLLLSKTHDEDGGLKDVIKI